MNRPQKIILILTGIALVGLLLFPPFYTYNYSHQASAGYQFIFNMYDGPHLRTAMVDTRLLLIQCLLIALSGSFFYKAISSAPQS